MEQFQPFILENQSISRVVCFFVLLLLLLIFELIIPRRKTNQFLSSRRLNNFSLLGIDAIAVRLFIPLATFEVAMFAAENQIGLFNTLSVPYLLNIILTIVIFDLLIYVQHVIFHKIRFLWRIHRVHHTDLEFDVTTGIRFHPIEILLSFAFKLVAVYLLGPAALAIVLYEIILNSAALFTHSNIKLNQYLDMIIRKVFVTPDMHRVHHSILRKETDSNYGNLFSFWDKLFGTYRKQPEAGYDGMIIGLDNFRDNVSGRLINILKNPFMVSR